MFYIITLCLLLLQTNLTLSMNEQQPVNQNKPNTIPTLSALCRHQITKGYGITYEEQRKNALQSLGKLYSAVNDEYMEEINHSFINNHWDIKESPSILIQQKNKLYGMFIRNMEVWDLSATINGIIVSKTINNIHTDQTNNIRTITCALASKNNNLLYTGSSSDKIKIWNSYTDKCIASLPNNGWVDTLAENNNDLYSLTDKKIHLWDLDKKVCKQKLPEHPTDLHIWSLLADNNEVYAAGAESFGSGPSPILIYDIRQNNYVVNQHAHNKRITNLVHSKKNHQFYSSSFDKTIKIWDMRNMHQSLHTLTCDHNVHFIQENDLGTLLFSGEITNGTLKNNYILDGIIKVWDTTDNIIIIKKIIPDREIRCMAYDEYEGESRLFIGTNKEIQIMMPEARLDKFCGITEK